MKTGEHLRSNQNEVEAVVTHDNTKLLLAEFALEQ